MKKILIVALVSSIALFGCSSKEKQESKLQEKLEKAMTELAEKYYKDVYKGNILNIASHEVTVQRLKDEGYDVSKLIEPVKGSKVECSPTSYSIITLTGDLMDPESKYTVENFLVCGSYKSPATIREENNKIDYSDFEDQSKYQNNTDENNVE